MSTSSIADVWVVELLDEGRRADDPAHDALVICQS